jgi:phenylalanyl-tRNA synthetase alpha chain
MLATLESIKENALVKINQLQTLAELENVTVELLGRKSGLTMLLRNLGSLPVEERKTAGKEANNVKLEIESALHKKKEDLTQSGFSQLADSEWLDVTAPGKRFLGMPNVGTLHPITQIRTEVEDIFTSMGFLILDGPEMETEYFNFVALNMPDDHPARDSQDTFWLENGYLMRTQTSNIQVRGMKKITPPFRAIAPGRCFRNEATDASHEHTFYQVEGLMIDRNIAVANLIYVLKKLVSSIMKEEVEVRLRPGYFPFVEPGFELDMKCRICKGQGCSVCKKVGWIEVLPCGMVHPNVLTHGGLDPKEWTGFAFGLGLDRLAMMRYGISDIRHFHGGDLRFLTQF